MSKTNARLMMIFLKKLEVMLTGRLDRREGKRVAAMSLGPHVQHM